MTPALLAGLIWVSRTLRGAQTAGFSIKGLTWYQYALTETRAIFAYFRLAVFPLGQSVDHDFPVSHSIADHGAGLFLALTLIALTAAILLRRRHPLSCFGFFLFLILLAPTSSVIPLTDPFVERRMYLPLIGVILMACDIVGHMRRSSVAICALNGLLLALALLCYQRNLMWGQPDQILASAAQESTRKARPYLGFSEVLISEKRCSEAIPLLERGERLMPNDFGIQLAWGKILECQGKRDEAISHLRRAAAIQPTSFVYQLIGFLYGEMGKMEDAGRAFADAEEIAPNNSGAHSARGLWLEWTGHRDEAEQEYRRALELYGYNSEARTGLARIQNTAMEVEGFGGAILPRRFPAPTEFR